MIVKASELAFLVTINNDKSALYTTRIPAHYRAPMIVYRLLIWPLSCVEILTSTTYLEAELQSTRDLRVVSGFSGTWRKGGRARMHGSPGDPKSTEGVRGVEWIATLSGSVRVMRVKLLLLP
jgi:hypothetical protein